MKKQVIFLLMSFLIILSSCSQNKNMVFVKGGSFTDTNSVYDEKAEKIQSFYIGRYEVTQKEWLDVMEYNPSHFIGDDLPVEMTSWYDCIEYCNKRSMKEGFDPYYNIDKINKDPINTNEIDNLKWTVTINEGADGYRLPTEAEWEYAAGGGRKSKNYTYSGSNNADEAAWYWRNAGEKYLSGNWNWPAIENNNNKTRVIGTMKPNELGIYDMSGNVREWCWDWYEDNNIGRGFLRVWKGGGWIGDVSCCEPSYRGKFEASGKGPDQGFRVCRSK